MVALLCQDMQKGFTSNQLQLNTHWSPSPFFSFFSASALNLPEIGFDGEAFSGPVRTLPASHSCLCPHLSCLVLGCHSVRGHIPEQIKQQGWQKSGPGKSRSDKVLRLASAVHLTFPAWDLLVGSLPKRFHFKQSCQKFRQGTESPTETPIKEPEFLELRSFPPNSLTFPSPVSAMGCALFSSDSTEAVLSCSCQQNCVMSVFLSLGFKESLTDHYSSEINKLMVPQFFPQVWEGMVYL